MTGAERPGKTEEAQRLPAERAAGRTSAPRSNTLRGQS